jgi:hypothetical protein
MSWDELTEDELAAREVAMFPPGCRFALIIASYSKWALAACDTSAKLRLEFLEGITSLVSDSFNSRALAEVKPCCETTRRMIETALANDGDEKLSKSFGILTGREVFAELLRLNPSWMWAIRLCSFSGARAAEQEQNE